MLNPKLFERYSSVTIVCCISRIDVCAKKFSYYSYSELAIRRPYRYSFEPRDVCETILVDIVPAFKARLLAVLHCVSWMVVSSLLSKAVHVSLWFASQQLGLSRSIPMFKVPGNLCLHMNKLTTQNTQLMLASAVAALSDRIPESWFGSVFIIAACSDDKTSLTTSSAASHVWHSQESKATVAIHKQVTKISIALKFLLVELLGISGRGADMWTLYWYTLGNRRGVRKICNRVNERFSAVYCSTRGTGSWAYVEHEKHGNNEGNKTQSYVC